MSTNLVKEDVEKAFAKHDKDGLGKLDKEQLKACMLSLEDEKDREKLEKQMNEKMMDMVFSMADDDGDKMISLDELLNLAGVGDAKEETPEEFAMKAFRAADVDGDGFLDEAEISKFIDASTSGVKIDVKFFMQMAVTDGDGKVSIAEAAKFFINSKTE